MNLHSRSVPNRHRVWAACLLSLTIGHCALRAALPAARDTSFQTLGMDGLPNAAVVLPDGKILIGGNFTTVGGTSRPGLARLNADGTLDESFAPPVAATGPFGKPVVTALARLADGRFFAAGQPSFFTTGAVTRTNIIRFNANGSVDPTFNAGDASLLSGFTVQADGKVLYTTFLTSAGVFGPTRLNADGSPDASFHFTGGINPGLQAVQLHAQPDGHTLVLQGDNNPNIGGLQNLVWLKADGSQDTSFKFPFQLQDESRFAVAADGSLLVAGLAGFVPQIQKIAADGTADASFIFQTQPNGQGVHPVPAAFLPDGGAVIVRNPTAGDRRVSFFYLTPAGKLAGSLDLPNAGNIQGLGTQTTRAFAMQPDGKLLFAQVFVDGFQNAFGMFRLPVPPAPAPPVITVHPETKTIGAGESLFLSVTATSGSPLTYQWQHAGTNLTGQTTQSLSLFQNSSERAGNFLVIVGNAFGSVTSQVATITIRPPAAMVMTQQPVGGTVRLSQNFNLTAQFTTEVNAGFQWFKNNAPLANGAGQGFGFASVNLPANDTTRTGDYFVVITNDFGGALTSSVVHVDLILPGPPQLTVQPSDLSLFPGQPVQLGVTAIADGVISYQWVHAGTNLLRSATIPNANAATLFVNGTDANRGGEYSVIATVTPGGSTTSRVAQVTLLPSGPPVLLSQPASVALDFAQSGELSVGFNGEAPVTVYHQHAGTNVPAFAGFPGQTYAVLNGPATNTYFFNGLPATAGDHLFVVSNRFGSVTSAVATVTVRPLPPATITKDLADSEVGIGEFNTAGLRDGLVVTNCCGQPETTHILELAPDSAIPPFTATGVWHLAFGISNRFYVGAQNGVVGAAGTWGFVPGAAGFMGAWLTNFPTVGIVSRLETFDDGRYGLIVASGSASPGSESGTFRVLGPRRPATNVLSFEVVSSNAVQVVWFKDGQPLSLSTSRITMLNESLGAPPAVGGVNQRTRLTISDVVPEDAGRYQAVVTNLVRNPDTSFGQPAFLVISATLTREATLTVRGYAEGRAPQIVAAAEFGTPTGLDDVTALAVAPDNTLLLGTRSFFFGAGSGERLSLTERSANGATNRVVALAPESAFASALGPIKAVLSDGQGGAVVAGNGTGSGSDSWYLRRVRPTNIVTATLTNLTYTNFWTSRLTGPFTNGLENAVVQRGADVVGLLSGADGVLVAGNFMGRVRFGATNVVTNAFLPQFTAQVGGITITNAYDAAFGRYDGSRDLYVAKYDLLGRLVWVRQFGGTNNEVLTSFAADAAGNLYLGGSFKGRVAFGALTAESTKVVQSATVTQVGTDGFVAKLDATGQPQWVKNFGGTNNLFIAETLVTAVTPGTQGVFFTANRSATTVMLQPGVPATPRYLAGLSGAGDLLWTQEFTSQGNVLLATDSAGNAVLADSVQSGQSPKGTEFGAGTLTPLPWAGAVLAKFSPAGSLKWFRSLDDKLPFVDDARSATVQKLAFAPNGELVIAGKLPGGTSSAITRSSGQRFDLFELPSTNNMVVNSSDIFLARLAPEFVAAEPQFVREPVAQTGLLQDRLVLEGAASGSPAPAYQWLFNGVPIPGATARVLIFPELYRTNRGNYALVASNAFGVTTSPSVTVTPQLRPNMTGWSMVTSATNYLGKPERLAADDAGNVYLVHNEMSRGAAVWLEKFNPDGHWAWRYTGISPNGQKLSPLVAPTGEVFVVGNVVTRLNPTDGSVLWNSKIVGGNSALVAADLEPDGHIRVAFADRTVHRFDFSGSELSVVTLANLPTTLTPANSRVTFARDGAFYFYGNRVEAINLGPTNLAALGNGGAQNWVLARYDATGAFQWSQTFSGPTIGLVDPFRLLVDASGNALVAGCFGIGNQANLTFQIGTNQLKGYGYAAKVTPAGDVAWAKAWWLNVDDAALGNDGSVYLAGWFRNAPTPSGLYVRQIPFGTNIVAGSSLTGHDTFVAKVGADGSESFIRHTGSPDFKTFDNAREYNVAVNASGTVWTAGFALFQPVSAALDFGDLRYQWPDLRPYNIGDLFGDIPTFYVARLEANTVPEAAEVTFDLPAPGSNTMRLTWPPGYRLQHRATLYTGDWETLNVTPPYDAALTAGQGYFRVIP